ncbi:MAG: sulfate adenylyltransferase, partial [Robiginitalea sp.]|uniref:elongation factor 1-alpha C-terminal domain-related protein n=1 Tax=Robiginitalea sp. TaxID=1902411 RepID=UPI003C7525B3
ENMTWYQGAPLLHTLETLHISSDINKVDARFPVQTVLRPQSEAFLDYRAYAGRVAGGIFRTGDEITVLPSGFTSRIVGIDGPNGPLEEAFAPMSISIRLEDDIDISRGDMIVRSNNQPVATQDLEVMLCWLNNSPAKPRTKYTILHTSNRQKAVIKEIIHKIDIQSLNRNPDDKELNMNEICKVKIRTTKPLMIDPYRENRSTGSVILVDDMTNETVAAGMIL